MRQLKTTKRSGRPRNHSGQVPMIGSSSAIRVINRLVGAVPLATREEWEQAILELWNNPQHSEELCAAIGVLWHPRYRHWAGQPCSMAVYRKLLLQSPSAECVDAITTRGVSLALAHHPDTETGLVRSWALANNPRLRRAAIRAQHRRRMATDTRLLLNCIVPNLADRNPLVRSAIAPALIDYGRSGDPARLWVLDTLQELAPRLPHRVIEAVHCRLPAPALNP